MEETTCYRTASSSAVRTLTSAVDKVSSRSSIGLKKCCCNGSRVNSNADDAKIENKIYLIIQIFNKFLKDNTWHIVSQIHEIQHLTEIGLSNFLEMN